MRQYEEDDCVERARKDQKLGIGHSYISISPGCECDIVAVFGNNQTRNNVWVPFGSRLIIENNEYEIIEGEKYAGKRYCKTQEYIFPNPLKIKPKISGEIYNHSTECLLDENGKLHSLEDFIGKEALVKKLAGLCIPKII